MRTYYGFPQQPPAGAAFLTIGNFDGVHRGHQWLVTELIRAAHGAGASAGVLTFDPHPLAVLRPDSALLRLTSMEERSDSLSALGLDFLLVLPFTDTIAHTSAADFMRELLAHLPVSELWIGPDFALGRNREGHAGVLQDLGAELGFAVRVLAPFDWHGEPVRSSRVRALLAEEGDVAQACGLLGRPYQVWGVVEHGAHRGRHLGFPTANLAVPSDRLVPAYGVYACWAWIGDRGWPAVVNIGVRPSFENGHPSVEAYLLDFDEDLYGRTLGLSFVQRLRGEQRFTDIGELVTQIRRDVAMARRLLSEPPDDAAAQQGLRWQEIPHTADRAIRVQAGSQRELFAAAAKAMFALQDADLARPAELAHTVNISADDLSELIVVWLNELLLVQDLAGALLNRFEIHEISDRGMRAVAYGYRGYPRHTAIKATTFSDLSVRWSAEGWEATITFDV